MPHPPTHAYQSRILHSPGAVLNRAVFVDVLNVLHYVVVNVF